MQYTHRKLHRSVTEMRRSRSGRARVSARGPCRGPRAAGMGSAERTSCNATTVLDIHKDYSGGMREIPSQVLSIILERAPIESPWATHAWNLLGVVPDQGGEPRTIVENGS